MSIIHTNYIQKSSGSFANAYIKKAEVSYSSSKTAPKESVVEAYKRKHPESAAHVSRQVQAGKKVWAKNGMEHVSRDGMPMEEYQRFFYALLDTIPYDSTRVCDVSHLSISDKGWEQMKQDSEYEAWILGYFVEDRAVRNHQLKSQQKLRSFLTGKPERQIINVTGERKFGIAAYENILEMWRPEG